MTHVETSFLIHLGNCYSWSLIHGRSMKNVETSFIPYTPGGINWNYHSWSLIHGRSLKIVEASFIPYTAGGIFNLSFDFQDGHQKWALQ